MSDVALSDAELAQRIASFPEWHYDFDLRGHHTVEPGRDKAADRAAYFMDPLIEHYGGTLEGKRVLDLGCNAGYFSLKAIEAGCDYVLGIDGRQMHIDQANLVFEVKGVDESRYDFVTANILDFDYEVYGQFDIVLCLGVLNHVSKPISLMERIAPINTDLLVVETKLERIKGSYLALVREGTEGFKNAVDYGLVMIPTAEAVLHLVQLFGYDAQILAYGDEGSSKYRFGLMKAFVCSKGSLAEDGVFRFESVKELRAAQEKGLRKGAAKAPAKEPAPEATSVPEPANQLRRELGLAVQWRRSTAVEVSQPLVLISQIQRGGGTLLSQLFDGHPQCHVHPSELKFGSGSWEWPKLDLSAEPTTWWQSLLERRSAAHFLDGYKKGVRGVQEHEVFPFLLPPSLARELFVEHVEARAVDSSRAILDAYFTAYFNGWLDNQNLYPGDKRWVVALAPGFTRTAENTEAFFADYPDGKLISVVRDPAGWYASARAYNRRYRESLAESLEFWRGSTEWALESKRKRPDDVFLVRFELLVENTKEAMGQLASLLGIELPDDALMPTFNRAPIMADSSFPVDRYGVIPGPATRGDELEPAEFDRIQELTADLYKVACEQAI